MANNQTISFHAGLVTTRDASTLKDGELTVATGCEYRAGSIHIYKQPGRTKSSVGFATAILAVHKLQYDTGTDVLIAVLNGTGIRETTPSLTPFGSSTLINLLLTADKVPHLSSFNDSWILCNGTDVNYIREANAVPTSGWLLGNWRPLGMFSPSVQPTFAMVNDPTPQQRSGTSSGSYTNNSKVTGDDSEDTYSYATRTSAGTTTGTYGFSAAGTHESTTDRILHIRHSGASSSGGTIQGFSFVIGYQDVSVSVNGGGAYTVISTKNLPYNPTNSTFPLADGVALAANVLVRVRTTITLISGSTQWGQGRLHSVYVDQGGAPSAQSTENSIYYAYTERYEDSDGQVHESAASPLSDEVVAFDNKGGVELTLPASPVNSFAQKFVIYRTLDEEGGGYPIMYEIDEIPVGQTAYFDNFASSLTLADGRHLYDVLTVLYGDGSTIQVPINTPPPLSKMALQYQGSMVYVPTTSRRLYYSIPATIGSTGAEQVPELYYLEFATPVNDTIRSISKCNSGRSLLVFFETYTMMVNYLPQATDPGVFDNRVTEYVSTQRGAAGTFCTVEVDLGAGRTVVVAVDDLGVWATDGVSTVQEWSNDLLWDTAFSGVTKSDIELVNNPEMRRVELLFLQTTRKEYHFYYGRMKQDVQGATVPLITGPHPMGVRSKHYNTVNGAWTGWSGDASTGGFVFTERESDSDTANGFDVNGNISFSVKTGDFYLGGLGTATILNCGYPKFSTGTARTLTLDGTFRRDGSTTAQTSSKSFLSTNKKVYWHKYADRHSLQLTLTSTTDMPALVAYEVEPREGGLGRDK